MADLFSVVLKLKAMGDAVISPTQGYHAYAMLLELIRKSSPSLAEELHDMQDLKPFTLSPLQGRFRRSGKGIAVSGGDVYSIRVSCFRDDLLACLLDSVVRAGSDGAIRLESATFAVLEVATTPLQSPYSRHQTFAELVEQARPEQRIELEFLSPSVFRSAGKRNVLYPDPRLVFGSYLSRWNAFLPVKIDVLSPAVLEQVRLARYKLQTRILHFNSYQEVGFEGRCTYELPDQSSEEIRTHLNALADFAFYCGTGAKTTMGMGQTRRLPAPARSEVES